MKLKKLYALFSLLVVFSMILAACAPAAETTEAPAPTDAPAAATEAPMAATESPAPAATDRRARRLAG